MGRLTERISAVARAGSVINAARWKIETVARVGMKLGIHRTLRWPGAARLAIDASRGRVSSSTSFRVHAADQPDRVALVQAGVPGHKDEGPREVQRISYGELDAQADRIASALHRRGVGRGSAVLVMLKNRVQFFVLGLAAGRAGASHVTVSWRSTVPELEYLARHSGAEAVFFDADVAETIREAAPRLTGIPRRNLISVGGAAAGFPSLEEISEHEHGRPADASKDASLVMYTSGTTGKPKGAVRKLAAGTLPAVFAFLEQTPIGLDEVHLTVCPVYHASATGFSTFTFLLGGTVVVMADFRPEAFVDTVERYGVTSTVLVPTMIHRLVELGPARLRGRMPSLRALFSGGAPLPGALATEALAVLGDRIYNFYGSTETGIVTVATPADLRAAPATVGRAIPGCDIRLVDEHGRDVPAGSVGELYARSAMMVDGYHADAEATRGMSLDGYFSVGDLARRDHDGRFHIEGRKRDMIISGGVNVYPVEIEAALEAHPAVAEVAVVGVPDKEWGERVRAFVVLRPGQAASGDDLSAHCRARLSGAKVPRDFVFLESLPRNPTGKILKRELRSVVVGAEP
jgi:fatty-acyl-CoA synthase